jgi:catechol 2,3-dioxygenase-like lactoylglutathione lyase family enzyme
MKIKLCSHLVEDQAKALTFYTEVLGFVKKTDLSINGGRWLTVVSPEAPDEVELALEPTSISALKTYQKALFDQGIPLNAFEVDDLQAEHENLMEYNVVFRVEPTDAGDVKMAIFEDTCGNLIQLYQVTN